MSKIEPLWLDFLFLLTNVSAVLSYWTNYRMEQIRGNYQPEGADPTFVISGFLDFSSPENENLLRPLAEDCLSTWNTQIEFHGKYETNNIVKSTSVCTKFAESLISTSLLSGLAIKFSLTKLGIWHLVKWRLPTGAFLVSLKQP